MRWQKLGDIKVIDLSADYLIQAVNAEDGSIHNYLVKGKLLQLWRDLAASNNLDICRITKAPAKK